MDLIFYNNPIARILYSILGNKSYAIGPIIITSLEYGLLGKRTLNHLLTHVRQWIELFLLTLFIGLFAFGPSVLLFEISALSYYIIYLIEVFIRIVIYNISGIDRYSIYGRLRAFEFTSFEREALDASRIPDYHENLTLFNWIRYLK